MRVARRHIGHWSTQIWWFKRAHIHDALLHTYTKMWFHEPTNSTVLMHILLLHSDPLFFKQCEQFFPANFVPCASHCVTARLVLVLALVLFLCSRRRRRRRLLQRRLVLFRLFGGCLRSPMLVETTVELRNAVSYAVYACIPREKALFSEMITSPDDPYEYSLTFQPSTTVHSHTASNFKVDLN